MKWVTRWHAALVGALALGGFAGYALAAYLRQPDALVLGVVAGLLTTLTVGGIAAWFNKILVPWHQDRVYRGVRISAEWSIVFGEIEQTGQLRLSQNAFDLSGDLQLSGAEDLTGGARRFSVKGDVVDGYLRLTGLVNEPDKIGSFALLASVRHAGYIMEGVFTFQNLRDGAIHFSRCYAYRAPATPTMIRVAEFEMHQRMARDAESAARAAELRLGLDEGDPFGPHDEDGGNDDDDHDQLD